MKIMWSGKIKGDENLKAAITNTGYYRSRIAGE
jgi:hypothetical protein